MLIRKYPKCPKVYLPKLSAQAQKIWDFDEKILHLASIARDSAAVNQACRSKIFPAASLVAYTILGDDGGHSVRVIGNF